MSSIQIKLYSITDLFDHKIWEDFFEQLEKITGLKLSHLDTNDPVRRKISCVREAAGFVCDISNFEASRTLFAKFDKSKLQMTITLYKSTEQTSNNIILDFPEKYLSAKDDWAANVFDVFLMSTQRLKPFYSLCDFAHLIYGKRKLSGFSIDLQAELPGIFWLTFFTTRYVEYFGKGLFVSLHAEEIDSLNGVLIKLGDSPNKVEMPRAQAESLLGKQSFVDPTSQFDNPRGKNALLFSQLIEK
jgi:hypothetical protein